MSLAVNTYNNNYAMPVKKNTGMQVSLNTIDKLSFKSKTESTDLVKRENPVNKTGEYALAISKSFYQALGTSARVCLSLLNFNSLTSDDDGGLNFTGLATIGVIATVATFAFVLPKAIYQANIDFFTKEKELDVYSRESSFKSTVYEKLDEKTKKASPQELEKLSEQSLKLKMANSKLPDSIKNSQNFAVKAFAKGYCFGNP